MIDALLNGLATAPRRRCGGSSKPSCDTSTLDPAPGLRHAASLPRHSPLLTLYDRWVADRSTFSEKEAC